METGRSLELSTDPDVFLGHLRPGDVVLFDSLHPLSALIQLAENRPVSHAGLYLGEGKFAQVARESRSHPAAARIEDLDERLGLPYDRTATALRHIDVVNGAAPDAVVKRAHDYTDPEDTTYAYLSLISLMVPALFRTYEEYFDAGSSASQRIGSVLETLSQAMLTVFEPETAIAAQPAGAGKKTLTCSEFVYRCFLEADRPMPVLLKDPLFAHCPAPPSPRPDPGDRLGFAAVVDRGESGDFGGDLGEGALILTLHRSLTRALGDGAAGSGTDGASDGDSAHVTGEASGGATDAGLSDWDREIRELLGSDRTGISESVLRRDDLPLGSILVEPSLDVFEVSRLVALDGDRALGGRATRRQLAAAAVQVIWNLVAHNASLGKYGTFRPGPGVDPEAVLPDTVTPKDLWGSDSLVPVAILHRPPGDDSRLDKVQHH
jgi:hypothetical protein